MTTRGWSDQERFHRLEAGDARWEEVRRALGQTAEFAARVDLASMRPAWRPVFVQVLPRSARRLASRVSDL